MTSPRLFEIPEGSTALTVKLIAAVNFGPATMNRFVEPPVPYLEKKRASPSLSFLLEHPSGQNLVWDLGIRKDYDNYAPSIANYIPTCNYDIQVTKNVADVLEDQGIKLDSINAIIWSHWHWDHVGDPSTFPSSTDLVVGPGFPTAMMPGYPANPDSPLRESDWAGRKMREITFKESGVFSIGKFPAFDYFGDGSFYLLNSPGHAVGHLCGLARTTVDPPTFVLLGGDICHYAAIFRPSKHLPIPDSIVPHPFTGDFEVPFCPGGTFEKLQKSRNRKPGDSIYDITYGHDIPLAMKTKGHLEELDCDDDVFVITAHDATVRDAVDHFPMTLNNWKDKGWGKATKWAFFKDFETYWQKEGVDNQP